MFGAERDVYASLLRLRDEFGVTGIKAEFEAEGSTQTDLIRLRRITMAAGMQLHLKIGGVEAVSDIRTSVELGVDGLVAPMVESPFGLKKFLEAYRSVYGTERIALSINIETAGAVAALDGIIALAKAEGSSGPAVDDFTIGRTDLSASWMDPAIVPDCPFILDKVREISAKAASAGIPSTLGGSISAATAELLRKRPEIVEHVVDIETRKVIIPKASFLAGEEALDEALHFEEVWILSRAEVNHLAVGSDIKRLEKLRARQGR